MRNHFGRNLAIFHPDRTGDEKEKNTMIGDMGSVSDPKLDMSPKTWGR